MLVIQTDLKPVYKWDCGAARLPQTDRTTLQPTLTLAGTHLDLHSLMGYGLPVFYSCFYLPWKAQSFTLMHSKNSPKGSQRVRQPAILYVCVCERECVCLRVCVCVSLFSSQHECVSECEFAQINR